MCNQLIAIKDNEDRFVPPEKRTPGAILRGRDCHSRLGSIAMTERVFLLYTGRTAATGLAMTTILIV